MSTLALLRPRENESDDRQEYRIKGNYSKVRATPEILSFEPDGPSSRTSAYAPEVCARAAPDAVWTGPMIALTTKASPGSASDRTSSPSACPETGRTAHDRRRRAC